MHDVILRLLLEFTGWSWNYARHNWLGRIPAHVIATTWRGPPPSHGVKLRAFLTAARSMAS